MIVVWWGTMDLVCMYGVCGGMGMDGNVGREVRVEIYIARFLDGM